MTPEQRPAVAAIAAALVTAQRSRSVYDHALGRHVMVTVDVEGDNVRGYDYGRSAHLTGRAASVFDYGAGSYLQFRPSGQTVSGYDYASGHYFEARVNGRSVSLYDYQAGRHFAFSIG